MWQVWIKDVAATQMAWPPQTAAWSASNQSQRSSEACIVTVILTWTEGAQEDIIMSKQRVDDSELA